MNTSNVWYKLAWSPFKPAAWCGLNTEMIKKCSCCFSWPWAFGNASLISCSMLWPNRAASASYKPFRAVLHAHYNPACLAFVLSRHYSHVTANLNCRRSSDCRTPFALTLFYVWTECHAFACDYSNMHTDQSLITCAINLWIWYALHGIAYHSKWMCQQKACTKILICCCTSWHQCAVAEACGIIHTAWTNLLCRPSRPARFAAINWHLGCCSAASS